jgi:hypothetical protein
MKIEISTFHETVSKGVDINLVTRDRPFLGVGVDFPTKIMSQTLRRGGERGVTV